MLNRSPAVQSRSRHYGSNFIYAYSHKLGKVVTLESNLEYWHFLQVELDPEIVRYEEHPDKITIIADDGKERGSIFDMSVIKANGTIEYREIKYSDDLETDRTQTQVMIQKAWCEAKGYLHRVVTEKDIILGDKYIYNLSFLYYRLFNVTEKSEFSSNAILETIKASPLTIRDIIEIGYAPNRVYDDLAYLYSKGKIQMDIKDKEIGFDTEVRYG